MKKILFTFLGLVLLLGMAIPAAMVTAANDGGFSVVNTGPVENPWVYDVSSGSWYTDGTKSQATPTSSELISPQIPISNDGPLTLFFDHLYSFEYDGTRWDGGQVRISVNGDSFLPVTNFTQNGYTGIITGNNVLKDEPGFNENSAGFPTSYITSVADLPGPFSAGDTLQIEFLGAWDEYVKGSLPNWEIDQIQIYSGSSVIFSEDFNPNNPPDIPTLSSPGDGATGVVLTPNLVFDYFDPDDDDCASFEIVVDDDAGFGSPEIDDTVGGAWPSPGSITYNVTTPLAPDTQYYWMVNVSDGTDWSDWSDIWDFTTGIQGGASDKDEYRTHEDVYVNATGFPTNSPVDVYVVDDGKWHDGDTIADYGVMVMETFTTDSNGDIVNERLWRHPLEVGEYDIVYDAGPGGIPDGIYDEIPDLVDDPNHPGFTVISTPVGGDVYPIDKTAILLPWLISGAILVLAAGGLILVRRTSRLR